MPWCTSSRQFCPKSSNIIKGVEVIDDEWSDGFHALQLLFLKVKPTHTTEFMCHMQDMMLGLMSNKKTSMVYMLGSSVLGSSLPLRPCFLLLFLFGLNVFALLPTGAYARKMVILVPISILDSRGFAPPILSATCMIAKGSTNWMFFKRFPICFA